MSSNSYVNLKIATCLVRYADDRLIDQRFLKEEDGVTAVEYGLIAGLVAVALVTAVGTLTGGISGAFTYIASKLPAA